MVMRSKSLQTTFCKLFCIFSSVLLTLVQYSCSEKEESLALADDIQFSRDTLRFDSVFAAEVSPTQFLRIYNRSKSGVRIPKIELAAASNSTYTLLLDGKAANEVTNLRIAGRDSLTLVVRLRPEVIGTKSVQEDGEIRVHAAGGRVKQVILRAWGLPYTPLAADSLLQNIELKQESGAYMIERPLIVPKGYTLRIPEGVKLYFRPKAYLKVYGSLFVQGSTRQRVLLAGMRLDSAYKYTPGQWLGVRLMPGSGPHFISHATFRAAVTALRADSILEVTRLENCIFSNSSRDAIALRCSSLEIEGSIFAQNTGAAISLRGGLLRLTHCTLSGTTRFGQGRRGSLLVLDAPPAPTNNELEITNSILWGNYSDEIYLSNRAKSASRITARYSVIKQSKEPAEALLWERVENSDPQFEVANRMGFDLKETSPARGRALNLYIQGIKVPCDISGRKRIHVDGSVDIGALVWHAKE